MAYSTLDADKIVMSFEVLSKRIVERFPKAGLYQVSQQLLAFCQNAKQDSAWVAKPIISLKIAIALLALMFLAGLIWSL